MKLGDFFFFDKNESKASKAFALLGLIVFFVSTLLFINDGFFKSLFQTMSSGEKIAIVQTSSNDVRRRSQSSFSWFSLDNGETLYENDLVFSGRKSKATILLNDGSQILVSENSLVSLKQSSGETELTLKYGKFSGSVKNKPIKINVGGQVKILKPTGDAKIEVSEGLNGTEVKVLSGNVKLNDKIIRSNQKLKIKDDGKVSAVVPINLELIEPRSGEKFWLKENDDLQFRWSEAKDQDSYELFIATDPYFSDVVYKTNLRMQTQTSINELAPGRYYWKVETSSGVKAVSETNEFKIYPEVPVDLNYPPNETVFAVEAESIESQPTFETTLVFEDQSRAESFRVQVSNSPDFSAFFFDEITEDSRIDKLTLPPGEYFWRVRVNDPHRVQAEWSQPFYFRIDRKFKQLPAPVLLSESNFEYVIPPQDNSVFKIKSTTSLETMLKKQLNDRPTIRFESIEGSSSYEIQVADDYLFQNGRKRFRSPGAIFHLFPVKPGQYFYRMKAVDQQRPASEYSQIVVATVKVSPPDIDDRAIVKTDRVAEQPKLELAWSKRVFARQYRVEIAKTENFIGKKEYTTRSNRLWIDAIPGKNYYYRVTALDSMKKSISDPSKIGVKRLEVVKPKVKVRAVAAVQKPKKKRKKKAKPKEKLRSPASLLIPITAKFANWPWWQVEVGSFAGISTFSSNFAGFSLNNNDLNQNKSFYLHGYFSLQPNFLINGYYESVAGELADIDGNEFSTRWIGVGGRYRFWGHQQLGLAAFLGAGFEQAEYFRFNFESDIDPDVVNRPIALGSAYFSTGLEWRSYYQLRGQVSLSYYYGLSSSSKSADTSVFNVTNSSQVSLDTSVSHSFTENTYLGIGFRYRLINYNFTSNEFGDDETGSAANSQALFRIFIGAEH